MYTCFKSQLPLTGCERLFTMVCCIIRSVSIILFLTQGSFCAVVTGPSNATVVLDQTIELVCVVDAGDFPSWRELFPDGTTELLYTVTTRFSPDNKYRNFYIAGNLPDYNLRVETVQIEDEGVYECATTGTDISGARLSVEAEVTSVSISCPEPCEVEGTTIKVKEGTGCECTCSAFAGYPRDLVLMWSAGTQGVQTNNSAAGGPNGTYDFQRTVAFTTTRNHQPLKCEVVGYTIESIIDSENIKKEVDFDILYAPNCTLDLKEVEVEDSCTLQLSCRCDGNPEPMAEGYKYFRDNSSIDGSRNATTETLELDPTTEIKFTCSGSNSLGDGERSSDTPYTCAKSDNLGLIIGVVIAAVVVGGGAIGFSVYWFGIRTSDQESVKRSNNTVTASTNETTNSAAPVYGVVNKSTKKKSDNTDGNGVNSKLQSEPDQVEYAAVNKPKSDPQPAPRSSKPPGNNTEPEKMELQYADIDHSNRGRSNEIHQPADAPTEYATVQSVIV